MTGGELMALLLGLFFAAVGVVTVWIFVAKVWWLPELISVHGAAIDDELVTTLIIAGVVFFLAQVGLGYFIWKFRGQGGKASYWHENSALEFTWTAITLVIFVGLGVQGNRIWAQYFQAPVPAGAVMVELTAQQFAWNIRYPGADGVMGRTNSALIDDAAGNYIGLDPKDPAGKDDVVTQNLMAIPVNRPIRVTLRSKDVTHSFFVPQLRVKQDAVPGLGIGVSFTATKTGEYEIACAELCGMQHYKMRGRLMVMTDADYAAWLKTRAAM
jgi:cytochrome c oxidase subunit II